MKNKFLLPLILLLSGCTTGFFNMANIEVFIVEELKTPTFSKASGTHCPFYLDVKAEDGEEIYYEIRDKAVERNAIEKRYSEKLFIDKTCYVSVYSKKDNKVSKVGTTQYTILNVTLDTPDVNYKSGVYDPFMFEFINKDTSGDIIYSISDKNINIYDDITETYSAPIYLEHSCIISAYIKSGDSISPIVNYEYIIGEKISESPLPSCLSGTYSPFFLSFGNSEKVYYSIGKEFNTEYNTIVNEYTEPMLINDSVKISVFIKKGLNVSDIMYLSFNIDKENSNSDIAMSKSTGSYCPFDLSIGSGIAGGIIYYTVGSEAKTEYSQILTQYTKSIPIISTSVVSVYVKNGEQYTNIQTFRYTIYERALPTPVANKLSGEYSPFSLSFLTGDENKIKYVLSDHVITSYDEIGTEYTQPFVIDKTTHLAFYARNETSNEISAIANLEYTINLAKPNPPVVSSYKTIDRIEIKWEPNEYAKFYNLYVDTNPLGTFTCLLYSGTNLEYSHQPENKETIYYYKLKYLDDSFISIFSNYSYGVGSGVINDSAEPNNTIESAAAFISGADYSIYASSNGIDKIEDVDYYTLSMPAKSRIIVSVDFKKGLNDNDLTFNSEDGEENMLISDGDYFSFINNDLEEKYYIFSIESNKTLFFNRSGVYKINIQSVLQY